MDLQIFENKEQAVIKAQYELKECLENVGAEKQVLLLVSGGSALDILPNDLKKEIYSKLTIAVIDERVEVPMEDTNYYRLTQTEFFKSSQLNGATVIDISKYFNEDPKALEEKYSEELVSYFLINSESVVVATLGMGSDGHTVGIMPMPEDPTLYYTYFSDNTNWFKFYDAGDKNKFPNRLTATHVFLKDKVNHAFAYVVGEEKKEALDKLKSSEDNLAEIPARIWYKIKNLRLYTDIK